MNRVTIKMKISKNNVQDFSYSDELLYLKKDEIFRDKEKMLGKSACFKITKADSFLTKMPDKVNINKTLFLISNNQCHKDRSYLGSELIILAENETHFQTLRPDAKGFFPEDFSLIFLKTKYKYKEKK